jgi:hypothetical protein
VRSLLTFKYTIDICERRVLVGVQTEVFKPTNLTPIDFTGNVTSMPLDFCPHQIVMLRKVDVFWGQIVSPAVNRNTLRSVMLCVYVCECVYVCTRIVSPAVNRNTLRSVMLCVYVCECVCVCTRILLPLVI